MNALLLRYKSYPHDGCEGLGPRSIPEVPDQEGPRPFISGPKRNTRIGNQIGSVYARSRAHYLVCIGKAIVSVNKRIVVIDGL